MNEQVAERGLLEQQLIFRDHKRIDRRDIGYQWVPLIRSAKVKSAIELRHDSLVYQLDELIREWKMIEPKDTDEGDPLDSYKNARHFIDAIPISIPLPEIGFEADGEIAFDWIKTQNFMFSVSVGSGIFCHYAGVFGENTIRGKEEFKNVIPQRILRIVQDNF